MGSCSSKEEQQQRTADRREARVGGQKSGKHTVVSDQTTSTQLSAAFRERQQLSKTTERLLKEKEKQRVKEEEEAMKHQKLENPLLKPSLSQKSSFRGELPPSAVESSIKEKRAVLSLPDRHDHQEQSSEMGDVELSSQVGKNSSVGRGDEGDEIAARKTRGDLSAPLQRPSPAAEFDDQRRSSASVIPSTFLLPHGKRAKRISSWIEETRTFQDLEFQAQVASENRMPRLRQRSSLRNRSIQNSTESSNSTTNGTSLRSSKRKQQAWSSSTAPRMAHQDREIEDNGADVGLESSIIGSDLSGCSSLSASQP